MQVTSQYAEEHIADLLVAADSGQEVEISRPGKPALKLVVSNRASQSEKFDRSGAFGALKGQILFSDDWVTR